VWGLENSRVHTISPSGATWKPFKLVIGPAVGGIVTATIPSDAATVEMYVSLINPGTTGTTTVYAQRPRIRKLIEGVVIEDNAITAGTIATGAVTAAKLEATMTLTSLLRTAASGIRVEVEGTNALPLWYGTSTKSKANASFYVDDAGEVFAKKAKLNTFDPAGTWQFVTSANQNANVLGFWQTRDKWSTDTYADGIVVNTTTAYASDPVTIFHPENTTSNKAPFRAATPDDALVYMLWLISIGIDNSVGNCIVRVKFQVQYSNYNNTTWYTDSTDYYGMYGQGHRQICYPMVYNTYWEVNSRWNGSSGTLKYRIVVDLLSGSDGCKIQEMVSMVQLMNFGQSPTTIIV
jgi:hypothetical protein